VSGVVGWLRRLIRLRTYFLQTVQAGRLFRENSSSLSNAAEEEERLPNIIIIIIIVMSRLASSFLVLASIILYMNLVFLKPLCGGFQGVKYATQPYEDAPVLQPPKRTILPDILITVVGLESSGTTFVYDTLSKALGVALKEDGIEKTNQKGTIRVQHLSLPSGWFSKDSIDFPRRFEPLETIPVYVPKRCSTPEGRVGRSSSYRPPQRSPPECKPFGPNLVPHPPRYFVNITSHIEWHRAQGVDARAVVVVRDPALHFHGIIKAHNQNETAVYEQYKTGRALLKHAVKHVHPVMVSYETLMTLQADYLMDIYKQLNISSRFIPSFQNGNVKYVSATPKIIRKKLQSDQGRYANDDNREHHR
jgi:hypothetical protein